MKLYSHYIGCLLALSSITIQGQSAKEIIAKNIEQTGGITHWKKLNTIRLIGRLTIGAKESYPLTIVQARPNLARTIIRNGKKETTLEGYDGKKGYAMNYATGLLQEYKNYQPEPFDSDLIDYESKGFEAQIIGKETLGKQTAYKIELTKNVNKTYYYFDTQTYMLLKEERKEETFSYSEFKQVGAYIFPFRIEGSSPKNDQEFVMLFHRIEINTVLDNNTFKF